MTKIKTHRKVAITKNQVRLAFAGIMILAIFSALVVWPSNSGWFSKFKIHLGLDLQGGTHLVYEADVSEFEEADKKESVEGVRDVIERRVNAYGVSEPTIQTNYSGNHYRIIVELAGVQDVNQAIEMIGATPLLEFKVQGQPVIEIETEGEGEIEIINPEKNKAIDLLNQISAGSDFTQLAQEYSEDLSSSVNGGELPWITRGQFVPEFDQAIFDNLTKGEISSELIESQFGYHVIKKVDERINEAGVIEVRSAHILFRRPDADLLNITWDDTGLSGKDIKKAQLSFDNTTQEPLVLLRFNDDGKELFAQLTADHVGEPIGIFLDGLLRSSPVVQEPIKDGSAQISGNFNITEAKQLVKDLNLGALPVPIELISQQTVGATLGETSVEKSLLAGIIGLIAAALFMLAFYRLPGLLSVISLAIYTILTLAIFELIPVTMTLAGVAGFILSIGMAVDANILIFERTKEELYNGKSLHTSIENGFTRAWPSIRDSNISSIITCIILAWFGTSIIKGFAITLAIGILMSMFSAITVTRTFLRMIVSKKLEGKLALFGVNKTHKE